MITLTRLRHNTPFILNPDLIERIDTHVDTVVRLTSGTEYVVNETGEEIVRRTAEFRARVLALSGTIDTWGNADRAHTAPSTTETPTTETPTTETPTTETPAAETVTAETVWAPADDEPAGDESAAAVEEVAS